MPGDLAGRALAARARELQPGLKVLFASGHPNIRDSAHGAPEGAVIMAKPFRAADLARSVKQILTLPE